MKIAVIKTGGKQYLVSPGQTIRVEKQLGQTGDTVSFDQVLLAGEDTQATIGTPTVTQTVTGTIAKQGRLRKVDVVKYKNKTRYKRTLGHRQYFTDVTIDKIA